MSMSVVLTPRMRLCRIAQTAFLEGLCCSVHRCVLPAWQAERMMKSINLIGVLLVVLGLAALAYQGFGYTSRDTVLDVGPFRATTERSRWVALPPLIGAAAVAAGVGALALGMRKTR